MERPLLVAAALLVAGLASGCGGSDGNIADLAADASLLPDLAPPNPDKAANCASVFGDALPPGFGRYDGILRAVVPPGHPSCAQPNKDHLVVQIDIAGATYRMVVNVQSDHPDADPAVRMAVLEAPLAGPAYAEGAHVPVGMDYVQSLNMHSTSFTPHPIAELVTLITAELEIGAPVAVFASGGGGASTHLIHRNAPAEDGALVTHPTAAAATWLLLAFSTQIF